MATYNELLNDILCFYEKGTVQIGGKRYEYDTFSDARVKDKELAKERKAERENYKLGRAFNRTVEVVPRGVKKVFNGIGTGLAKGSSKLADGAEQLVPSAKREAKFYKMDKPTEVEEKHSRKWKDHARTITNIVGTQVPAVAIGQLPGPGGIATSLAAINALNKSKKEGDKETGRAVDKAMKIIGHYGKALNHLRPDNDDMPVGIIPSPGTKEYERYRTDKEYAKQINALYSAAEKEGRRVALTKALKSARAGNKEVGDVINSVKAAAEDEKEYLKNHMDIRKENIVKKKEEKERAKEDRKAARRQRAGIATENVILCYESGLIAEDECLSLLSFLE